MLAQPLPTKNAAHLATVAKVYDDMVSYARLHSAQTGSATTVYQRIEGIRRKGAPPESLAVVTFSTGFADDQNNGWAGMVCVRITNQKELNAGRRVIAELLTNLRSIDCEWIHL